MTKTAPTQENQGVRHRPQSLEGASLGTSSSPSNLNSLGGLSVIVSILFPFLVAIYRVGLGWTDGLTVHYHHNLICIVVLADTKCFEDNLSRRRDSGFITYRVATVCPKAVLQVSVAKALPWRIRQDRVVRLAGSNSHPDFYPRFPQSTQFERRPRSRLSSQGQTGCRWASEWHRNNYWGTQGGICGKARNYLVFLLERFLCDISFNADNVKGMSSFDRVVLLTVPSDQAALCSYALYYSFSLQDRMVIPPGIEAQDEYPIRWIYSGTSIKIFRRLRKFSPIWLSYLHPCLSWDLANIFLHFSTELRLSNFSDAWFDCCQISGSRQ